nr:guanine nucleotide-binding protein beta SU like protein [Cryptomonas curvata]
MKLNHYGTFYNGGKIYFFKNKKKTVFFYKNMISIIDFKLDSICNFNFYLRSKIISFDVDRLETIILVVDSSMLLVLVDINNHKIITKMILKQLSYVIKISPFGKYFIIDNLNKIELWKFSSCSKKFGYSFFQIYRTYNQNYSDVHLIEWSNDGNYLISVSIDKVIKIFSFRKRNNFKLITLNVFFEKIFLVRFFYNSKRFLVLSEKNILTEWVFNLKKKKNKKIYENYNFSNIRFSRILFLAIGKLSISRAWLNSHSRTIFLILSNGQVSYFQIPKKIYIYKSKNNINLNYNTNISQNKLFKTDPFDIFYLTGSFVSNFIAIGKKKKKEILIYDWLKKIIIIKHKNFSEKLTSIALSPNDKLACTCNLKGHVIIWSLLSGFSFIKFRNHINSINRAIFLENNSRLITSSGSDGTVKIYDLKKCTVTKSFTSMLSIKNFDAVGIDKSGSFVASACIKTFLIFIWSLKTGLNVEILKNHQLFICDLYFTRKNLKIVTGSYDKCLILWHFDNRVYNKQNISCEIFKTYFKIISIEYHPFRDEIAVLFDSYCISFFRIKKTLEIISISIDIKKSMNKFYFNLELSIYISIGYLFNGKALLIIDSKFQLVSFKLFPLHYSNYHKILSVYLNNKNFYRIKTKNKKIKFSKLKNFALFYYCEGFFSLDIKNIKNKISEIYDNSKEKQVFQTTKWKKTFKWASFLHKKDFLIMIIDRLPFNLVKKFLNFLIKHSCSYKIKNIMKNYIDLFLNNKLKKETFNANFLYKVKIFFKYLLKQINQIRILSLYFLNFIQL